MNYVDFKMTVEIAAVVDESVAFFFAAEVEQRIKDMLAQGVKESEAVRFAGLKSVQWGKSV